MLRTPFSTVVSPRVGVGPTEDEGTRTDLGDVTLGLVGIGSIGVVVKVICHRPESHRRTRCWRSRRRSPSWCRGSNPPPEYGRESSVRIATRECSQLDGSHVARTALIREGCTMNQGHRCAGQAVRLTSEPNHHTGSSIRVAVGVRTEGEEAAESGDSVKVPDGSRRYWWRR